MKENILLLTKDAMCKSYLPIYGNSYWKGATPNLDELAEKGTVFEQYYTSAPSTVMSFRGMMFGKFAHEMPYSDYSPMEIPESEDNFFNMARSMGYECHLLWDEKWERMVLRYGNCLGDKTIIHNIKGLNQSVGPHCKHKDVLKDDDAQLLKTISILEREVQILVNNSKKKLVWIHLPHVIMGRTGYGEDIDAFDLCIGMLRKYFDDNNIFISADHGNMDGYHGKFSYGFDVYTSAIEIPLITPRINNVKRCKFNVSNIDIKTIVLERIIPRRDFIYSDCAYYAQPHRKIAILYDDFAYIYNKASKKEELYDLLYDKDERCNLMEDSFFDKDRKLNTLTREVYFSPRWDEAICKRSIFRKKRDEIWKEAPTILELRGKILIVLKTIFVILRKSVLGK